jgi:IS5 family transposase
VRATARQISFADWELMRQGDRGVRLEPLLEAISAFLDDLRIPAIVISRSRRW